MMRDGPSIGLGFQEGFQGLLVAVAHGHPGHIDVAIGHGHQAQVFLGETLALGGKAGHSAARGGLGGLSAGVGIDFGIQHQQVDVAPGGEDVIETAVTDIVGPAVAADDPDGFLDQGVGHGGQVLGLRILGRGKFLLEGGHPLALLLDAQVGGLVGVQQAIDQVRAEFG